MAAKAKTRGREAAEDLTTGRMTARVEAKITPSLNDAITEVAVEMAGGGDPRMFRSRAVRELIIEAVMARRTRRPRGGGASAR